MISQQMVDSICLQIQDLIIERNDALELIQQHNGKIKLLEEANLELFNKAMQYLDERDALKADADRYRWLRDAAVKEDGAALDRLNSNNPAPKTYAEFDAAIDAAKGE